MILAFCLVPWLGQARSAGTLSLDEAVRLAATQSRQIAAIQAQASAAREMAVSAAQRPDPVLRLGINNLPVDGPDRGSLTRDFMTMRSIGVMQEFTRADKRRARSARFDREAEAAEAGRAVALANVRRDIAMAWLDRHYQERMRDLLQAQRAEAELQAEAAQAAYRGGRGAQADVFAARTAVAQIEDRIRLLEIEIAMTRTRLARWIGLHADRPLAAPPRLDTVGLDERSLDGQIEHHPEIALMASQEAVARAETDIAQSNRVSDWSAELMVSQRGSAYSNMVSLNVSIPLQIDRHSRQDRELAAKTAMADQMRAQREDATREHVAEIRGWLQQWRGNQARLVHYDSALVPLAEQRTRAAIAAYRGGSGTLPAVLEARRMEIDLALERLRIEMDTAAVWARLAYLIPAEHQAAVTTAPAAAQREPQR